MGVEPLIVPPGLSSPHLIKVIIFVFAPGRFFPFRLAYRVVDSIGVALLYDTIFTNTWMLYSRGKIVSNMKPNKLGVEPIFSSPLWNLCFSQSGPSIIAADREDCCTYVIDVC